MTTYGYARVSTTDQSLDAQLAALKLAGAQVIFSEQLTGKTTLGRDELGKCLDALRAGDTLLVTKIDRVARSMKDLANIVAGLVERNVGFRCVDQAAIDTTSLTGRLMLNILGAFAEFELGMIAERRAEGIRRAQLAGKYVRPGQLELMAAARRLRLGEKLSAVEIANRLDISVRTVYRLTRGLWSEPLKVAA
jgi:DNA invertase Pin-like site-specific DNA recombinase